jgi:hypothetical protein
MFQNIEDGIVGSQAVTCSPLVDSDAANEQIAFGKGDLVVVNPADESFILDVQDFRLFNYDLAAAPPELRVDRRKKHLARVALWYRKRRQQQAWFARTGADVVEYRQRALMTVKRDIERELLAVMTGPVGDLASTGLLKLQVVRHDNCLQFMSGRPCHDAAASNVA